MGYRKEGFSPSEVYHIFNRGVEKRNIFRDDRDRRRFRALLAYCFRRDQPPSYSTALRLRRQGNPAKVPMSLSKPGEDLVDRIAYSLMPNHFHLQLRENVEGGISKSMQRLCNSYARYFNTRHGRTGPLFSGPFRAVRIPTTELLLHVSRYIHLNPYVVGLTTDPLSSPWSSLGEYLGRERQPLICHTDIIRSIMSTEEYRRFILNHADYARSLATIEHLALEPTEPQTPGV